MSFVYELKKQWNVRKMYFVLLMNLHIISQIQRMLSVFWLLSHGVKHFNFRCQDRSSSGFVVYLWHFPLEIGIWASNALHLRCIFRTNAPIECKISMKIHKELAKSWHIHNNWEIMIFYQHHSYIKKITVTITSSSTRSVNSYRKCSSLKFPHHQGN